MVQFTSQVVGNVTSGSDIWKSCAISWGCYIQGFNVICIGYDTRFGPGVNIIVVGAGSIVTESFPERSEIAGNPAREIKRYFREK